MIKKFVGLAACAVAACIAPQSFAQDYPSRPLRMIIPFAPGGASDLVGRIIQPRMTEQLGQQVVVDNRGGAAGNIGVEIVATAAKDGYTILLGNIGTMSINPAIYPRFPHQPARTLTPVVQVVDVPGALVVTPSLPAKTVKELVDLVRANPNKYNYGSPGPGSANRLEMEVFRKAAGLEMTHIPYKGGAGPAVTGLLSGEHQLMFVTLSSAASFVKSGKMRALAITAPKRSKVMPDVPTMAEVGFPGSVGGSWQGIFLTKGSPDAAVKRMFDAMLKVMAHDDVRTRLNTAGVEVVVSASPEEFARFVAAQTEKWGKVVKEAGATAD
jgi:tripartite-type tricarboxylate transporter receptor subunit TctC